jgi:hypothetical protein
MNKKLSRLWIALILCAGIAACTSLDLGGTGPAPNPTSSATSGPTPGVCGTPASNPNLVLVAMGNNIAPTYTTAYGIINGYAVIEKNQFPYTAMLINQWSNGSGSTQKITPQNVLQFTNVDSGNTQHSAVGFKGDSFPSVPHTFPSAAASPVATAVSTGSLWSTGRIDPPISQQCYSQAFTLSPGVYYFGDLDYYNLSNFRDVLIVATTAPSIRHATTFASRSFPTQ